jgi:hypothetical protein
MPEVIIEQAIYGSQDAGGYQFLARSAGFQEEWLPAAEQLCSGFGERPVGVACPACIFAQPFGKHHVAIVQVADQGSDDAGRPGALGFRLLVMGRAPYTSLIGDPFAVAERFPPPWQARGELAALSWPVEPLPARTVAQVQKVLQRPEGPALLGGTQALVDGGRLVFERPAPDAALLQGLWTLLPTSTRSHLWPASFAFDNALGFDAVVAPRVRAEAYADYIREEQAAEYPEGRYELHLQIAAEAGDQKELDALFARRSHAQTVRLGPVLLALFATLALVSKFLTPSSQPRSAPATTPAATSPKPQLRSARDYPTMDEPVRRRLTQDLREFAVRIEAPVQPEPVTAESLVEAIDRRLGTPDPLRDPGEDLAAGPLERRLRALLWKHGVAEYDDKGLNPTELVERLDKHLVKSKVSTPGRK